MTVCLGSQCLGRLQGLFHARLHLQPVNMYGTLGPEY